MTLTTFCLMLLVAGLLIVIVDAIIKHQPKFKLGPIQKKWLKSLEQHPERQMSQALGTKLSDGTYQACCLGEGGLIAKVCEWKEDGKLKTIGGSSTGILDGESYRALGLLDEWGRRLDDDERYSLQTLNDSGKTWPQIAAILRANPEQYFNKSV